MKGSSSAAAPAPPARRERPLILTVGHSTRAFDDLVALLRHHGVELVADVRRYPGSRRHPQFQRAALERSLAEHGIAYRHLPELGGRRRPRPDSPNQGWRNASFRGYADHMQTVEFRTGLAVLLELAAHHRVAIMCAEAVPWRCHRSLIADALLVRGAGAAHIVDAGQPAPHQLTRFACVEDDRLTYPG